MANENAILNPCPPFYRGEEVSEDVINWENLITCLAIPLAVGSLSAFLTQNNMETFDSINKPFLTPPGWLFPVVWTILYLLMGIASYLVITSGRPNDTAMGNLCGLLKFFHL